MGLNRPDLVVQRAMNVVLPLKDARPQAKARLTLALARERDAINSALATIGAVHFARFNIVGPNLEFLSVYDGQATTYLTEFALQIGAAFDTVMRATRGWPPHPLDETISVAQCPAQFAEHVLRHDLAQLPIDPTALVADRLDELDPTSLGALAELLERVLEEHFEREGSANLTSFVAYGGVTVAQVRDRLGLGW